VISTYRKILDSYPSDTYTRLLAGPVLKRSEKFVQPADRDRFLAARILCVQVLSKSSLFSDAPIEFEIGPKGKPFLKAYPDFNWSHSGDMIALLVGPDAGVDVELVRQVEITEFTSVFSNQQLKWMNSDLKQFFILWTLKEAVMKACGRGFDLDPLRIDPEFLDDQATWTVRVDNRTYFGTSNLLKHNDQEYYAVSACSSSELIRKISPEVR